MKQEHRITAGSLPLTANGKRTFSPVCRDGPLHSNAAFEGAGAGLIYRAARGLPALEPSYALPIKAIHDRWISHYAEHAMNVSTALQGETDR